MLTNKSPLDLPTELGYNIGIEGRISFPGRHDMNGPTFVRMVALLLIGAALYVAVTLYIDHQRIAQVKAAMASVNNASADLSMEMVAQHIQDCARQGHRGGVYGC